MRPRTKSMVLNIAFSLKKRFNVDSPSFTPSSLAVNGTSAPSKTIGLSPRTASAAPFKPKSLTPGMECHPSKIQNELTMNTASSVASFSSSSNLKSYNPNAPDWVGPEVQEFLPQSFNSLSVSITISILFSFVSPSSFRSLSISTAIRLPGQKWMFWHILLRNSGLDCEHHFDYCYPQGRFQYLGSRGRIESRIPCHTMHVVRRPKSTQRWTSVKIPIRAKTMPGKDLDRSHRSELFGILVHS